MSDRSKIEWTDATWNPVTGYFEQGFVVQLRPDKLGQPLRWKKPRRIFVNSMSDLFHHDVPSSYIAAVFAIMASAPQHTFQILTKRPGRMRSLLTSSGFIETMYDHMLDAPAGRAAIDAQRVPWPLPNVWLGVSVENQKAGRVLDGRTWDEFPCQS